MKDSVTELDIIWKTPAQHIRANITKRTPSHLLFNPFVRKYGAPPLYPPWGSFSLYIKAIVDSTNAVAELKRATIHIQKTDPGPPTETAATTPARFPTPTLEAVLIQKAWNELIPSLFFFVFSVMRDIICPNNLNCTPFVFTVNIIPLTTNITTNKFLFHIILFTKLTIDSKEFIFPPIFKYKKSLIQKYFIYLWYE